MQYETSSAVDPELYRQLLEERYGPLNKLLAEQRRRTPPYRPRRTGQPRQLTPTPPDEAARHYVQLADAIGAPYRNHQETHAA
ncbi:hypothetical protein GCM10020367_21300 [Streptomyces sannanensis]|uniref:Uncharacterized protein n=1 Tax=Streptomyces sannanensis TaxID=285536 RepID=A0ABP6S9P6_9ACTN